MNYIEANAQLGEIRKAREIGRKGSNKYIWAACLDCGKERWVPLIKGKPLNLRCRPCGGKLHPCILYGPNHPNWKGGRCTRWNDYTRVKVHKEDFFYPMADKDGYIAEHRLIMAKHLCRCLLPWEVVHHKNGIKLDNRLENLELLSDKRWHLVDAAMKRYVKRLEERLATCESRITLLEAENALLRITKVTEEEKERATKS